MEYSIIKFYGIILGVICIYMLLMVCITYIACKCVIPQLKFSDILEFLEGGTNDQESN